MSKTKKTESKFTTWLKRVLGADLIAYAWVAELQKRGAVHYHLIVYTKKGASIPFPDRAWGRKNYIAWKWGYTKVEKARLPQYLASYVSKEYQKDYYRFPKNARGFGIWVNSLLELKRLFSAYMSDKQKPLWILQDFPNLDFLKEENQLKRIGGKWRIGSEILTSKFPSLSISDFPTTLLEFSIFDSSTNIFKFPLLVKFPVKTAAPETEALGETGFVI